VRTGRLRTAGYLQTRTEPRLCYLPRDLTKDMQMRVEEQLARVQDEVSAWERARQEQFAQTWDMDRMMHDDDDNDDGHVSDALGTTALPHDSVSMSDTPNLSVLEDPMEDLQR